MASPSHRNRRPHSPSSHQQLDPDGFSIGSLNTRRVEPRNTPSVINAVFNHRQFWANGGASLPGFLEGVFGPR
jgi:hypothetical protein